MINAIQCEQKADVPITGWCSVKDVVRQNEGQYNIKSSYVKGFVSKVIAKLKFVRQMTQLRYCTSTDVINDRF